MKIHQMSTFVCNLIIIISFISNIFLIHMPTQFNDLQIFFLPFVKIKKNLLLSNMETINILQLINIYDTFSIPNILSKHKTLVKIWF